MFLSHISFSRYSNYKGSAFKALVTALLQKIQPVSDECSMSWIILQSGSCSRSSFPYAIEDVSQSPDAYCITGRIERGVVHMNEEVEIIGITPNQKTVITGIEMFNKLLDQGEAGDNVGLLLRGIDKAGVQRGQVLAKPGSINPHTKFEGQVYVLSKEEGGRHSPFFSGYRPQFYFRTTDITGTVTLPDGVDMVKPGDNTKIIGELIHPIAMDKGLKFAVREGGRTIASGQVTEILA